MELTLLFKVMLCAASNKRKVTKKMKNKKTQNKKILLSFVTGFFAVSLSITSILLSTIAIIISAISGETVIMGISVALLLSSITLMSINSANWVRVAERFIAQKV